MLSVTSCQLLLKGSYPWTSLYFLSQNYHHHLHTWLLQRTLLFPIKLTVSYHIFVYIHKYIFILGLHRNRFVWDTLTDVLERVWVMDSVVSANVLCVIVARSMLTSCFWTSRRLMQLWRVPTRSQWSWPDVSCLFIIILSLLITSPTVSHTFQNIMPDLEIILILLLTVVLILLVTGYFCEGDRITKFVK